MFGYDARKILKNFKFSFEIHEWNRINISKIAISCDIGIIPINLNDIKASYKSENKLIFMWKVGLPVIASATPAYKHTMKLARVQMYAKNTKDWINILNSFYKSNSNKSCDHKKRINNLIKKKYSTKKTVNNWSKVFQSIGFKV